jgi:hypothetical protein
LMHRAFSGRDAATPQSPPLGPASADSDCDGRDDFVSILTILGKWFDDILLKRGD